MRGNTVTLLASQHLCRKATESIVPHFTNKKTEAQGKIISSRLLSIWNPGGPRIHYVVQAGLEPDPLAFACRVLRLQTNATKDQSSITPAAIRSLAQTEAHCAVLENTF